MDSKKTCKDIPPQHLGVINFSLFYIYKHRMNQFYSFPSFIASSTNVYFQNAMKQEALEETANDQSVTWLTVPLGV